MLIKRNLQLFFRDKANVFFSLMSVFIIIGLYALFMGDIMAQNLQVQLPFESDLIKAAIGGIMLGGMVAVTSVTTCNGAIAISIKDKESAAHDFLTSPISRARIALSYVAANTLIGLFMTTAALILCVVYLVLIGGSLPQWDTWLLLLGTTLLSVLCANSMMYFVSLFIKSRNAYSSFSTITGTLIGFLMGIYLPIGQLPSSVGWLIRLFPMSHAASMYRELLAGNDLQTLFYGAPAGTLQGVREFFGVFFQIGPHETTLLTSALFLGATTLVFTLLSIWKLSKK